jgi:hypothetical protein
MTSACTEDRFLADVSKHAMTVIHDDGVHRHLRFRNPETSCYWFDLITWPGTLCIDGDCGTYVFRRLTDMFEFFRTDREYMARKGKKLAINPGYWAEKVQAKDKHGGIKEFSEDLFNKAVMEHLVGWIRDHRDETTKDERRDLWDAVMDDVIGASGDRDGARKQIAAHEFSHRVNADTRFSFCDFYERNVEEYTSGYLWCCYAIAWGVKTHDESKVIDEKKGVAV